MILAEQIDNFDSNGANDDAPLANEDYEKQVDWQLLSELRLALTGESAVDTGLVSFRHRHDVDRFLRINQFDTDNPIDMQRLWELHEEAVEYLSEKLEFELPRSVEEPGDLHELFLLAAKGRGRESKLAGMTLKTMHILHHIVGYELNARVPLSESDTLELLSTRIFTIIDRMRADGVEVCEFAAGKKSRSSLVTKLLAKTGDLASHIFDRVRFRVVLETEEDVLKCLVYLLRHLVPYNYVVPEQSQNGLLTLDTISKAFGLPRPQLKAFWGGPPDVERSQDFDDVTNVGRFPTPPNEFSGRSYRCVNFVADIPIRIDEISPEDTPAIIFVQAEIQLVDRVTHSMNNTGENSHEVYKQRQLDRVKVRLEKSVDGLKS